MENKNKKEHHRSHKDHHKDHANKTTKSNKELKATTLVTKTDSPLPNQYIDESTVETKTIITPTKNGANGAEIKTPADDSIISTNDTSTKIIEKATKEEKRPFKCTECSYRSKHKQHLKKHLSIHSTTVFQCDHCVFTTKHKTSLSRHNQIHTDAKPYQCPKCEYFSRQRSTLQNHMKTHEEKGPEIVQDDF